MLSLSTGQIFFIAGAGGLLLAGMATVISSVVLRRKNKKIREEIWNEYK